MMDLQKILNTELLHLEKFQLHVADLAKVLVIIIITRLILFLLKLFIRKKTVQDVLDKGSGFAIYKLFKYFLFVLTFILCLEAVGLNLNILLAGSAALLVGLGLGIQQIFNDVVSGILLLFERSVAVHDIIEVDGLVGKVDTINLRTSKVTTRAGIVVIIPNSKLVSNSVINWTNNKNPTRFKITVGVAYGSDTKVVTEKIVEAALEQADVIRTPHPFVRFDDFGDSALVFDLMFWTDNMFYVEDVKSNIRYLIDQKFRESGVVIPFPQRDLHFKSTNIKLQ
jgi:small-conductance mechanosensitive channel